jgi:hypothetical protein
LLGPSYLRLGLPERGFPLAARSAARPAAREPGAFFILHLLPKQP